MSGILTMRDTIRDFVRKYDEIVTPIIRFIVALLMFWSINVLYGYSDLFGRGIVVFLMSIICALVSNTVAILIAGVVILVNAMTVSLEVGILFLIIFVVMYCLYMRMFPKCSWVLVFVPFLYLIKLQYAAPIVVAIFAGASGIVPTVFGVLLYYFAKYTKEVNSMLLSSQDKEDFEPYAHIIDSIVKNQDILCTIIVFSGVILITYFIYRMSFDYSWYIAIGVGVVCNILFFAVFSAILGGDFGIASLLLGSIIGGVIALLLQFCKSIVDYSRKEVVQYEDDEYYYYVKAIPKYNVPSQTKNVKKITSEEK